MAAVAALVLVPSIIQFPAVHVCLMAVVVQASETPFAADDIQDEAGTAAADRYSTIDEAAHDIADNWVKAPQPRRVAHRQKHVHQGRPAAEPFLDIADCPCCALMVADMANSDKGSKKRFMKLQLLDIKV